MLSLTRLSLTLCVAVGAAMAAEPASGTALSKVNVFAGPATAAAAQAASETIEFAGFNTVGKHTEYIFFDKTAKKSHWIAKGETKEGITVLNYDDQRQEAVVKINGTQKTLAMRKATGPANAPSLGGIPAQVALAAQPTAPAIPWSRPEGWNSAPAAPAQAAPAAPAATPPPAKPETPATPEAVAKAETEARMLVSDLLEIGMAQRKAYEEQQRKLAEGKSDQTAPAQPKQ